VHRHVPVHRLGAACCAPEDTPEVSWRVSWVCFSNRLEVSQLSRLEKKKKKKNTLWLDFLVQPGTTARLYFVLL